MDDKCSNCCEDLETQIYFGVDLCEDCATRMDVLDGRGLGCDGREVDSD